MKAKIKRHSRSALSVLLSLCMLVSCVTVGMIGTDAAQTLDAVGASADEASVGADLDKAEDSVGAEADGESVGSGSGYFLMGRNDDYTRFSDTGVTVTKSGSKYTAFIPKDTGSTWSTNSNFFIMLSSSASYTNGFYQNESITVTKSGDEINFYGSQSRDSYRFARFSFGSLTDVSGVEVTVSNKTYTIKVRKSTTTNYSVTVSAGANGSVLAGTNTISAGNFEDETIAAGASLTLTANPATGYSFKSWDVTGGATVASTTSASTTLSATDDGTVTATYVKNATATRRIYFDNSTANWLTPYAYAKKDGYPVLGSAPGTAMTYDPTDGVWYIDVDADATEIQFSNNGSGTSLSRTDIPSYNNPEFYNYNPSYTASGSWRKHEAKTLPNEVNASLDPTSITNNPDIYSNIKATFFDYFTDNEVGGSWYSSIVANSDAWIDTTNSPKPDDQKAASYWTTINRNPYKALNKALSVYANKNSVKYPIYFGAFNEGGYQNPGYYRSARKVHGHIINDSNQLGSTSDVNRWFRALPGLVGNSISDGSVHHVTTGGNNGAPMVLFDKEWLNTRTAPNNNSYVTNRIYFDPGDLWSGANANFRILQKDTGDWWDGSKLNYDSTQGIYYKDIVGSTTKIKFVRCDPRLNDGTFKIDKTNGTLLWSDSSLDCDYAWAYQEYNVDSSTRTGHLFRIKWENWTDKKYCDIINYYGNYSEYITNQKLGQVVNSSFPVVKRTTNNGNVDYYEFNSNGATDNVWFEGLTGGSPVLHYGSGTDYGVKNGYNAGYGFFPFDKNSDNSGYGKDLAFGMKLEIPFTLGPNGQIQGRDKNYYDQKFYFSGDDDLWVYVDGNLVLDLGGDHKMSEAEINFASRTISTTRTPNSTLTSDLGITRNGSFADWFNNDDTTKVHTMTIYYMERGMQESNLKFGFSFAPVDNRFIATEEIKLDGVNPALLSDVEEVAGGDKILVTHKAEAGNDNPTALATYKDYKHSDGNPGNTGSDGTYILANNDSATFIKQFNDGGTNENTDPADYFNLVCSDAPGNVFSYHTVVSKVTDLTMDHMIPTLRANPNIFKFRTTKNPKTGLDPTDIQADLLSTISTKSLIITKDILGVPEDTTNTFDITVEIDVDGDGTTYGYKKYALPYTLNGTAGTMTAGVSKVTIKKDDLVVITGIPEKAKIRLYETDPADTYEYYDTHIFDEDDEEQTTAIGKTAYAPSGYHGVEFKLISDDFVFVTNRPLPTYSITAQKDTNAPDTTSSFDFYIMKTTALSDTATLTPYTGDYEKISADRTTTTSGTLDASDGGKISLKSGEQFIISGLSQNDKYLVYESDPTPYSYSSTSTDFSSDETSYHVIDPTINSTEYKGVSLTIPNHDVNITISNERYYNITVTKALEGGDSTEDDYFPIYVQYKYAGGDDYQPIVDGEYGILDSFFSTPETISTSPIGSPDWYFDEDNDRFMLKAGKSFTLTRINNGDQFIVAEDTGNITGYTYSSTSASNGTGTVYTSGNYKGLQDITIGASNVTVTVTNAKDTGKNLKIYKKLTTGSSTLSYTMFIKAGSGAYSGTYKICNASDDQVVNSGTYDSSTGIEIETSQYILLERIPSGTEIEVTEADYTSSARAYHYAYSMFGSAVGSTSEVTATEGSPKKVDNGIDFTLTNDSVVEVYNKPWTYVIQYDYPAYLARYYGNTAPNQSYKLTGFFTDNDFDSGLVVPAKEVTTGSEEYNCVKFGDYANAYTAKLDAIKTFITSQAPYEDNFMSTLTWNPILNSSPGTDANTTIVYYPLSENHNISVTTTASEDPNKLVNVYFRLPYEFDSFDKVAHTGLDAKPETSGTYEGKVLQKDASNYRVQTQYGMWFTKNNSSDRNTAKWVQAPAEIYDSSGNKLVFRNWEMKSVGAGLDESETARRHDLKEEYVYKKCYNSEFNMTFYQDTYVEPIYIPASDPDAALSPSEREAKDAGSILYGGAIINFMENSRNQWNDGGGNLYGSTYENISSRINQGDRVFSDFLLSFNYLGQMLNSSLGKYIEVDATDELGNVLKDENGNTIKRKVFIPFKKGGPDGSTINYKAGFVLEEVAEIEDTNGDGDLSDEIKSQAEYNEQYNSAEADGNPEAKTQMDSALAYINSGTNPGGKFIVNDLFSATGLDNKNEIQYSTSLPIISHSTGAANIRKNKIYRAYAYLRDCTTGGSKSDYYWNYETISDEDFSALSGHSGQVLEISKPVYFTIYNIASVQNGTPFDDKGGQS